MSPPALTFSPPVFTMKLFCAVLTGGLRQAPMQAVELVAVADNVTFPACSVNAPAGNTRLTGVFRIVPWRVMLPSSWPPGPLRAVTNPDAVLTGPFRDVNEM